MSASTGIPRLARFFMVQRLGEASQDALASLRDAQEKAQRMAKEQGGQYGVLELVDAYQSGSPPVSQVAIVR